MTNCNFCNFVLIIIILDFANNCLFDNIFWVDEITIFAKKITLIDYQQQIVLLIGPVNHCYVLLIFFNYVFRYFGL